MNQPLFGPNKQSPYIQQLLAEQLRTQSKPIHNKTQGFAELGKNLIDSYAVNKMAQDEKEDQQRKSQALAEALTGQVEGPMPAGQFGPGAPQAPTTQQIMARLLENPDTADYGAQMMFGNIQNQQALDNEIAKRKALQPFELELAREKARIGQQYGSGSVAPSSVREYEYFNSLSPEEQKRYLNMKRATQTINLGGTQAVLSPTGGIAEEYEVTPKPDQLPEFKAAVAGAEAAAKMEAKGEIPEREKKERAQARVTGNLQSIADQYKALREKGGIIDTDKGVVSNLGAAAKSSGLGQFAARITGAEEQAIRDQINMIRPTLVNDVRQAAEMGAKGMDSEKELEFFLQAVSDPKRSIQANLAALSVLDRAYGLGKGLEGINLDQEVNQLKQEFGGSQPAGIDPALLEFMTPEERALFEDQ